MDAPTNVGKTTNQTIIQNVRKQAPFEIGYGALALAGMAKVERKHRSSVRQAIEEQLSYLPLVETRNRKPLIKLARSGEETWWGGVCAMKIVSLAETKAKLSAFVDECARSPIVITRNGSAVAVLVAAPADPDDLDALVLANNPRFRKMLRAARERMDQGEVLSHDEFWDRVEALPEPEEEPAVTAAQPSTHRRTAKERQRTSARGRR